jgi:PAS domain S-box-containing protein
MLEGVITTDEKGTILLFNPEASSIFGYLEDEVIGKNISMLMPSKVVKNNSIQIFNYFKTRDKNDTRMIGNRQGREVTALHKDKHTFPLRIAMAELPTITGDKMRFIASCQDLTEIEQQKEILNRTLKMESLGKVSGGIAHDFNNLLGIIVGYAELLKIKMKNDDEKQCLVAITNACERGAKLTKSLLTFSKCQPSEAKAYCINDIISNNKTMLQAMLTSKISLGLHLENEVVTTLIDKSLFEDMLLNFSINALQAMQNGGELVITTTNKTLNNREASLLNLPTGNYVKLTIKDSGCGMDEETLSKIYDPFFTTKEELGNGLGLYQCYNFVKLSHGTIEVQSTLNEGTTFCIYFPEIVKAASDIAKTDELQLENDNFIPEDYVILIVDDEVEIRYLNTKFLINAGFNVFSCGNAFDALEIVRNERIDFIITDVVMPKMSGVDFIKQAEQLKPAIGYLFVSGYLDINDSKEAAAIKPILYKPYKAENLIEHIKSSLY